MKNFYLSLAMIGFIAPTTLLLFESIETGNIFLYTNPMATIHGLFANRISTIFMIDLLFTVIVFFVWTYNDGKKNGIKRIGLVWALTMLLGLAGGFPFLFISKRKNYCQQQLKKMFKVLAFSLYTYLPLFCCRKPLVLN